MIGLVAAVLGGFVYCGCWVLLFAVLYLGSVYLLFVTSVAGVGWGVGFVFRICCLWVIVVGLLFCCF